MTNSSGPGHRRWQLQDAKNRFSEVVRLAAAEGPQVITLRGREAVVVVSFEEYERTRTREDEPSLFDILRSSPFPELEIEFDTSDEPPENAAREVRFDGTWSAEL